MVGGTPSSHAGGTPSSHYGGVPWVPPGLDLGWGTPHPDLGYPPDLNSPQYKNANIAICVLAVPSQFYWTTEVINLEV